MFWLSKSISENVVFLVGMPFQAVVLVKCPDFENDLVNDLFSERESRFRPASVQAIPAVWPVKRIQYFSEFY